MRHASLKLAVNILLSYGFVKVDGEWMAHKDGNNLPLDGVDFIKLMKEGSETRELSYSTSDIMDAITLATWELHRTLPHSRSHRSYSFC